jgi:hypothetical protein
MPALPQFTADGGVALRALGRDGAGRLLLAVHRQRGRGPLNAAGDFPAGRLLRLQRARRGGDVWVRVLAFEYGRYATLADFEARRVQAARPLATRSGILACEALAGI